MSASTGNGRRRVRRGSMLKATLATVATGALLTACGGAALSGGADEGALGAAVGQGGVGVSADVGGGAHGDQAASGSQGRGHGHDHGNGHGNGHGKGHGNGHGHGHGGGDGSDGGGSIELPEGWAGTISAETLPESSGTQYLLMGYLYGEQRDLAVMSAAKVAGSELFWGEDVECVGEASLEGASATCMLIGQDLPVEVRLVPSAFGHSALLYSADADGMTDIDLPDAAAFGLWHSFGVAPEDATAGDVEHAAAMAVTMANHPDGGPPAEQTIDCTLSDAGVHAVCEISGTEGGGGDGTWYATAQPGYQSDTAYLFTKLPA